MTVALRVSHLTVQSADGARLVRDVSIEVREGQSVGLVGGSGSGKTLTALAAIGMLPRGLRRTSGSTEAAGRDTHTLGRQALRAMLRHDVGYVPQDPLAALDPLFPIGDQVTEPARIAGGAVWREAAQGFGLRLPGLDSGAAAALLEGVGIRPGRERARQYPHQFSGGMRQRALIAAATSLAPRLVIADEPTTALDASLERQILDLLRAQVQARGGALLLISHDLNLIAWYCDHAYVMAEGAVIEHGPTARLFQSPSHRGTRRLLEAVPGMGTPPPRDTASIAPEPLLELRGISRRYGKITACDAVDLVVGRGELVGLVGESGSGKSTLGRIALGLEAPDSGMVRFAGQAFADLSGAALRRLRRRFQPVFQDPLSSLNPRWRVARSILHPLHVNGLCGWPSMTAALDALLHEVELPADLARRYPHEISGGQRQRACIARALATRPELLVADEALSALDVTTQLAVLDVLERLRARGMAILFISHDLRTVRRISDRVAVMSQGTLVESGNPETVFAAPRHPYTAALLASLLPPRFSLQNHRQDA